MSWRTESTDRLRSLCNLTGPTLRSFCHCAVAHIALIVLVGLGLGYGGFSYTSQTHTADVGALHLSVDEERRMNIPIWLGIGALVLGSALLLVGRKR